MSQCRSQVKVGRGTEASYRAGFSLELRCRFYLWTCDEINYFQVGGTGEQNDVASFNARSNHRLRSRAGKLQLAAHDFHRDQSATANLHRFDIQAFLGEQAGVLGDPDGQMGDGSRGAVVNAAELLRQRG